MSLSIQNRLIEVIVMSKSVDRCRLEYISFQIQPYLTVTARHKYTYIGETVISNTVHAALRQLSPFLQKLRLVSGLIYLLMRMIDELRQGLPVLDPIPELSSRVCN